MIIEKEKPVSINDGTFPNRSNATLYIPFRSKTAYEAADYWKEFKEIVEMALTNCLYGMDTNVLTGKQAVLPIELVNKDKVKLCQFDLRLPDGVTVATKVNDKLDVKLTERAENHSISSRHLANGDYRFVISSMDNDSFVGNNGSLVEVTIDVADTMDAGEYIVKVLNVELSVPDGNDLRVVRPADTESILTVKTYTPGDVNNDGSVSVTDVGCAINYILEQVPSVFVFEAADMNGDKSVSVTDVGIIINLILNDGVTSAESRVMADASPMSEMSLRSVTDGYELWLENQEKFIGFQLDVQLVDGSDRYGAFPCTTVQLSEEVSNSHILTCRKLGDGRYRVVCYSLTNEPLPASAAALLNIVANGDITLSDIRFTTVGLSEVCFDGMSANAVITDIADVSGSCTQALEQKVYALDGRLCRTIRLHPRENPLKGLKAGVYLIGNRKVVVR